MDYRQNNNVNTTLDCEMTHISYEGKTKVSEVFSCQMCGKVSKFKYLKYPHPAIQHLFEKEERIPITICKACAKREIGSKNKKGWERVHDKKET